MKIPLAASGLRDKDIDAIYKTLKSGNLTMGSQVRNFESAMSNYLGVRHFVMMNSGSSANLAIFEALLRPSSGKPMLQKGDGVLVPAIAWPTTIWPIVQLGLRAIFVDVDENTLAIDLKKAQEAIDNSIVRIRAIFPIHPLGLAIDHDLLQKFQEKNDLILVNDVCESLGSRVSNIHAGTTGTAASFSFYFSHHITTMEGGGVATNDNLLADDLRSIRSHGWSRDRSDVSTWNKNESLTNSKFLFVTTGYNIRPMEIQASVGILQLEDLETFLVKRRQIASDINENIIGTSLSLIGVDITRKIQDNPSHSWMMLPIKVDTTDSENDRAKIVDELEKLNIETRPVLTGNFLSQPALDRIDVNHPPASLFPIATKITETCFMVGAHHDLTQEQITYLGKSLRDVGRKYGTN